jgi:lipoprotein-anchoring transpeptidase ErfK/SrfK
MSRRSVAAAAALLALLVAAPAAPAADTRVIPSGVTVRGLDVSGRTVDDAARYLGGYLNGFLSRDVVVQVGSSSYRLKAGDAKLKFDALLTAKRAYFQGTHRPDPAQPVDVAPALTHSQRAVKAWALGVKRRATRPARNAGVRITVRHIFRTHSKLGLTVDSKAVAAAVDGALNDSRTPRKMRVATKPVRPKITAADVARRYGTIITIDRAHFTLRLFKRLKISKRYGIAVGMAGLDTPAGQYTIHDKQINPAWHVPQAAWAGSLAGQVIPGGAPNNPLKARWMGVANGVGIHGTAEDWSIGSRASHGCIRMHVRDVVDLFRRVSVGTPVLIK